MCVCALARVCVRSRQLRGADGLSGDSLYVALWPLTRRLLPSLSSDPLSASLLSPFFVLRDLRFVVGNQGWNTQSLLIICWKKPCCLPAFSGCSSASSLRPFFAHNDESRPCFYPFQFSCFCSVKTILALILSAVSENVRIKADLTVFLRWICQILQSFHGNIIKQVFVCLHWFPLTYRVNSCCKANSNILKYFEKQLVRFSPVNNKRSRRTFPCIS